MYETYIDNFAQQLHFLLLWSSYKIYLSAIFFFYILKHIDQNHLRLQKPKNVYR